MASKGSELALLVVIFFVTLHFTTPSLGGDGYDDAAQRSTRQTTDNNTQPDWGEEEYCEIPPPLDHGRFSPSRNRCPPTTASAACLMVPGTPVPPQWVIFHTCYPGYKLINRKTLSVCVKGKWVPPIPVCEVDGCHLPTMPLHGSYEPASPCKPEEVGVDVCRHNPGTLVPSSWTIRYTCNPEHYPNTTSDLSSCENATWTNPVGCENNNCPPLISQSVDVKCTKDGRHVPCDLPMKPNTVASLRCKMFYEASYVPEYSRIVCLKSGQWSNPLPSWCTPICGIPQGPLLPLILNGSPTKQGEFPWLVALYARDEETQKFTQICGGTLITPHVVLTAAHCVVSLSQVTRAASDFKVGLGKYYRDYYMEEPSSVIVDVIVPKQYAGVRGNYALNIALLDLAHSVQVTAFVMPACVDWAATFRLDNQTKGVVAGWGYTEKGKGSDVVLSANMTIVPYNECLKLMPTQGFGLSYDKFCSLRNNDTGPDRGDSGGGITVIKDDRNFVVGIVSHKINNLIAFTDLMSTEHKVWLDTNINRLKAIHKDD